MLARFPFLSDEEGRVLLPVGFGDLMDALDALPLVEDLGRPDPDLDEPCFFFGEGDIRLLPLLLEILSDPSSFMAASGDLGIPPASSLPGPCRGDCISSNPDDAPPSFSKPILVVEKYSLRLLTISNEAIGREIPKPWPFNHNRILLSHRERGVPPKNTARLTRNERDKSAKLCLPTVQAQKLSIFFSCATWRFRAFGNGVSKALEWVVGWKTVPVLFWFRDVAALLGGIVVFS
jgi:hypothetical protein